MNLLSLFRKPENPEKPPSPVLHLRELLPQLAGGERVLQLLEQYHRDRGNYQLDRVSLTATLVLNALDALERGTPPKANPPAAAPVPEPVREPNTSEMMRSLQRAGWPWAFVRDLVKTARGGSPERLAEHYRAWLAGSLQPTREQRNAASAERHAANQAAANPNPHLVANAYNRVSQS